MTTTADKIKIDSNNGMEKNLQTKVEGHKERVQRRMVCEGVFVHVLGCACACDWERARERESVCSEWQVDW